MLDLNYLNNNRVLPGDSQNGAFLLSLEGCSLEFTVVATSREGWEHVSVSNDARMPRWEEVQQVRDLFFEPDEVVMMFFPPEGAKNSSGENSIDLWRPVQGVEVPLTYKGVQSNGQR